MMGMLDKSQRWGITVMTVALLFQVCFLSENVMWGVSSWLVNVFYLDRELGTDVMLYSYWIGFPMVYLAGVVGSWFLKQPNAVVMAHGVVGLLFVKQLLLALASLH